MEQVMETWDNCNKDFITVVPVSNEAKSANVFVTVLKIGDDVPDEAVTTEEVLIYRLPGERLGFGLKFEGGTKSNEYVKKLFIQSCAVDSPASRVKCSWGSLCEGDEVLKIDSISVSKMTRTDCVRCLKDSNLVIKLLVRHVDDKKVMVAPPVPPRRMLRKLNRKDSESKADIRKPPEAQVYVDLFQEADNNNFRTESESDDTSSSISTVVDRFNNNYNLESVPSTPTAPQKQFNLNKVLDTFDLLEFEFGHKEDSSIKSDLEKTLPASGLPLVQDGSINFQDAPLSYGDETISIPTRCSPKLVKKRPPPPPPPIPILFDDRLNLPRLVDFLPKTPVKDHGTIEGLGVKEKVGKDVLDGEQLVANAEPLATISEDEEDICCIQQNPTDDNSNLHEVLPVAVSKITLECGRRVCRNEEPEPGCGAAVAISMPPVRSPSPVGQCHSCIQFASLLSSTEKTPCPALPLEPDKKMESYSIDQTDKPDKSLHSISTPPPSFSRLPPDGHEFPPKYQDSLFDRKPSNFPEEKPITKAWKTWRNDEKSSRSVRDKIAMFSSSIGQEFPIPSPKTYKTTEDLTGSQNSLIKRPFKYSDTATLDRECRRFTDVPNNMLETSRYSYSLQNLTELKKNSMNTLMEQRRKVISKLKGLVIPEKNSDLSAVQPIVDIPEIRSRDSSSVPCLKPHAFSKSDVGQQSTPDIISTPLSNYTWKVDTLPKYSPAFKRKSLQIYGGMFTTNQETTKPVISSDTPKSLESIASPTQSDFSFKWKKGSQIECDSDNDSAVSSSQSSCISPPLSPDSYEEADKLVYQRVLKAQSPEAINRRNILASAKCRSGFSFKIASPHIEKKSEKLNNSDTNYEVHMNNNNANTVSDKNNEHIERWICSSSPSINKSTEYIEPRVMKKHIELDNIKLETSILECTDKNTIYRNVKNEDRIANEIVTNEEPMLSPVGDNVCVIVLKRDTANSSIGITLAGGADYENKEIMVHKILQGTPAYKDGRLQKGDRIISINGINMKGVTHEQSIAILKAPKLEVILVVAKNSTDSTKDAINNHTSKIQIVLNKDGAGLGFSLDGGRDSPYGDKPLVIKKIFTGGAAEKSGNLQPGDELLAIDQTDVSTMSRIEVWAMMKKLPEGKVILTVRRL